MKKMAVILPAWMCTLLFLWIGYAQGSPVGHMPGRKTNSAEGLGLEGPVITADDRFRIVDQLGTVGIDDSSFFDFSGKREGGAGPEAAYDTELFTGEFGGVRTSIFGFDRGMGFDRRTRFDEGTGFDRGRTTFDQRAKVDAGAGFDHVGGFDSERVFQFGQESQRSSLLFRRDERFQPEPEKSDNFLARSPAGGRVESGLTKQEPRGDTLGRQKERLEQDLLKSEELRITSVRPTKSSFVIKVAMFAVALILLLVGTLKGLIPLRFYFFLAILILILWNPMESLFVSIVIGISALLAPILG
ncbi:MAG: hypothetical protein JRL30_21785 [Deltaproteobacteria bacterium]|nr:hypothetical protein [Deltaproteobacteria bacterium]